MAYEDFKDLNRRTFVYQVLSDNAFDKSTFTFYRKYVGHRSSRYVIDKYSKYACDILLKDKKRIANTNALQKILDESNRKPSEM